MLLIGSLYGDGEYEFFYGYMVVVIFMENKDVLVIVYDFGRYGKIYLEELGLGIILNGVSSFRGEGILRLWWSFFRYI